MHYCACIKCIRISDLCSISNYFMKMFRITNWQVFIMAILFWQLLCEPIDVKELIVTYGAYLNSSLALERNDKLLLVTWSEDFQVKQVNVTTKYRMQMIRHKEHSFRKNYYNAKWRDCLDLHETEVKKTGQLYYEKESECLKVANSANKGSKQAVSQVEKQMRNWRKGYKYLQNLCKMNNPSDKENAGACLVEYIQKDNYDQTLQRLIILKLEAMSDLFKELTVSVIKLEECLKESLSVYLDKVRSVMEVLNRCYQGGKHL